jgi:CHAT domain-containing protein
LVYARFAEVGAPAAEPEAIGLNKALSIPATPNGELGNRFDDDYAQRLRNPNDILELVVITPSGEPQRIVTGATREQVQQAVRQLQRELTDRTRRRQTAYLRPAQQLYEWLITPVEATLEAGDVGHVSFILDAGLRSLPLAALHNGEQFIIEKYSVGLMPSLSLTDTSYSDIRELKCWPWGPLRLRIRPRYRQCRWN